jgi:hypothetical protein
MSRRSISHSYSIVGTICIELVGAHRGRDHRRVCQLSNARCSSGGRARSFAATPGHAIDQHPMIAIRPKGPDLSPPQAPGRPAGAIRRESERSGTLPADRPAAVAAQFQPLDPGIVSEAIPAFFIGRNNEGFWVARDVKGRIGGTFLLKNSALLFARRNSQPGGCATIFPSERFELDLENKGNPLVGHLAQLKRLTIRHQQRVIALIDKLMKRSGAGAP